MSATLDGARYAALMHGAPVIESAGRGHPIELRHIGRGGDRIEDAMAAAIRRALAETEGGVLAFLPGVAEIERTAERLAALPADIRLHRLHGTLDPAEQRAAIAPAPPATRKIVLATAIAETSLTLDGVRVVIDSGLARRPRYDRAAGMTRLVTERASQAAVAQRAGRAGRQAPGIVYRLWEAGATAGLPRFDPPEILEADLSALLLDCALWGVSDPATLGWIDPPPPAAVAEARARLASLGALNADGRPTAHGRAIAALPLPPRLAHMLIAAGAHGWLRTAAEIAVLLSERGLGGDDPDLETRLRRWRGDRGRRGEAARGLSRRWAGLVEGAPPSRDGPPGAIVALAFPDRIARRRDASGESWASSGGRGFRLDPSSPLAREEWIAVADTQGTAAGARILSAAPIAPAALEALFADRIAHVREVAFDPATGGVIARAERRLGALRLGGGPDPRPDRAAIAAALHAGVRAGGLALLPLGDATRELQARAAFAARHDPAIPAIDDAALADAIDDWLPPLLEGVRRLDAIDAGALHEAIRNRIDWPARAAIDRLAPTHFTAPAGSAHGIDYAADAGPTVALRPQALFGLAAHPCVAGGRVPLVLSLVSPAGRPIQTTRDLPGFWAGSWRDVAREMRGRYPRHPWPDDPANAAPTLRTKNAAARA